MPVSSVVQNSSYQVLKERLISSIQLMVMNQVNHQDSRIANLQNLTSNPGPLLPTQAMWLQISWGDLIVMTLILVMLNLPLHSYQLNLILNQFQIQTPLRLNQLMIIKFIIFLNSSIQKMMKILWMLISRSFKLYWWSPLLQKFIYSLMCSSINMEEQMLQSQISCRTFLCLYQPRPL